MFRRCKYCDEYVKNIFFNQICENHKKFLNWKKRVTYNDNSIITDTKLIIRKSIQSSLCDYNTDIESNIEKFSKLKTRYFKLTICVSRNRTKEIFVKITDYKNQYLYYTVSGEREHNTHRVFICDIMSIELLNDKIWIDTDGYKVVKVIDNKLFALGDRKLEFIVGVEYDVCKEYKSENIKTSFYEYEFYDTAYDSNYPNDEIPFRFFRCIEDAKAFYPDLDSIGSNLKLYLIRAKHCTTISDSNSNMWTAQKITFLEQIDINT